MQGIADRLLREQVKITGGRREAGSRPFVRPVTIHVGRHGESQIKALSQDLSSLGIRIISEVQLEVRQFATIEIHMPLGPPVRVRSEVRWSEPYGHGWYASGWRFLDEHI
jgi:hypothetical protein